MPTVTWKKPIQIHHVGGVSYEFADRLEDKPGIYFFSRRFGSGDYEPFYIGKTVRIARRLNQYIYTNQPHSLRIKNVLQGERDDYSKVKLGNGPRFFHFGYIVPVQGQKPSNVISRAERALIQYARITGWKLINNHYAGEKAFWNFEMEGSRYNAPLPKKLIAHK